MKYLAVYSYDDQPSLGFPQGYPARCYQFETAAEASEKHPEADVMSETEYGSYLQTLLEAHAGEIPVITPPKPRNWFQRKFFKPELPK